MILELYAGGLKALKEGRGDNAPELLETLSGNSETEKTDGQSSPIDFETAKSLHLRESDDEGTAVYERGMVGLVGRKGPMVNEKRKRCPIDMPKGVVSVLRELLAREPGARPTSMEVAEEIT